MIPDECVVNKQQIPLMRYLKWCVKSIASVLMISDECIVFSLMYHELESYVVVSRWTLVSTATTRDVTKSDEKITLNL
jgi:hypothetical protein